MGLCLSALPKSRSGHLSTMLWEARGTVFSWAKRPVGVPSCPALTAPPRAAPPRPARGMSGFWSSIRFTLFFVMYVLPKRCPGRLPSSPWRSKWKVVPWPNRSAPPCRAPAQPRPPRHASPRSTPTGFARGISGFWIRLILSYRGRPGCLNPGIRMVADGAITLEFDTRVRVVAERVEVAPWMDVWALDSLTAAFLT